MAEIQGLLVIRHQYDGSKSEGNYAYLIANDSVEYTLCRREGLMMDDDYFYPFENLQVSVEGEVADGNFLIVEQVVICDNYQYESQENVQEENTENNEKSL